MKFEILTDILFELLSKRKATAQELAEKHSVSTRTVYRYIEILSKTVPVYVKRGRNGGVYLADSYKLPVGFMTEAEYEATIEALETAYAQQPRERFLAARRKLSAQMKTEARERILSEEVENVLVDGGTWSGNPSSAEKLRLAEECLREKTVLEIEYDDAEEKSLRRIEPHVLVFRQGVWYVYAFCHTLRAFRPFSLGRIRSALKTGERFRKRPFRREDIPLGARKEEKRITVRFEIAESALPAAGDLFGTTNLRTRNGVWETETTLPDDETLVQSIVAFGAGLKVLSPDSLRKRVQIAAQTIANLYN